MTFFAFTCPHKHHVECVPCRHDGEEADQEEANLLELPELAQCPNHQGIFYVHPELTHGSSLSSVSCRFTSISDRTGTHVGTCMHTRLHVEIAPILIPAQLDSSDVDSN